MKSDHHLAQEGLSSPTLPPFITGRSRTAPPPPLPNATAKTATVSIPAASDRVRWSRAKYFSTSFGALFRLRDSGILHLALLVAVIAFMIYCFSAFRQRVPVRINDIEITLWTRQTTVRTALMEAGITWTDEDIIIPQLDDPLPTNGPILIRPALPIVISVDGNRSERRTQAATVSQVLAENNIHIKPRDQVLLDGRPVLPDHPLRRQPGANQPAIPVQQAGPIHLTIQRALPIVVNDNGTVTTIYSTENTIGSALAKAGIEIYVGDEVTPDLTTPVTSGSTVYLRRSRPAVVTVDGRTIKTRTRAKTVEGLLAQEGIELLGKDYVTPGLTSPVIDYTAVAVTRVREEFITETEEIAFESKWLPNPEMEIDQRAVVQVGAKGIKNRLFKSIYENGKLISTSLEKEWIAQPPQNHIINYGTKIVLRDLTLPDGKTVQYWRKLRLLATAYSAATSGKDKSHPQYGRTRLGLQAGRGIVAVDPRVISLGSTVFVPGYGIALAGDTGGKVKGRRIDLGFPEDQLEDWYRWVDVYILGPTPPKSQINIVIPDYPVERKSQR